jgi:predicted O-methyltransferase YrrM
MVGVKGIDIDEQLATAKEFCPPEARERLRTFEIHNHAIAENQENGYGPIEAEFLYGFIAARRPRRVVQVGAGVSTAVILRSAADAGYNVEVTCVDPYPSNYLQRAGAAGTIKLFAERAQDVDLNVLTDVGDDGMLFVDSTHTVKAGSEVNRIILEALPRLPRGAMVHFHDIFFPYDYQPSIFEEPFFSQESTLLHAYLANNERYRVRVSMSMLHYARPQELQELLPRYRPRRHEDGVQVPGTEGHFPSATYLEVVA